MICRKRLILSYTVQLVYSTLVTNFKILAAMVPEKSVTETECGRNWSKRKKWANKGNDNQEETDTLLHDTTSHILCLYEISITLL